MVKIKLFHWHIFEWIKEIRISSYLKNKCLKYGESSCEFNHVGGDFQSSRRVEQKCNGWKVMYLLINGTLTIRNESSVYCNCDSAITAIVSYASRMYYMYLTHRQKSNYSPSAIMSHSTLYFHGTKMFYFYFNRSYVKNLPRTACGVAWRRPPECICAVSPIWKAMQSGGMVILISSLFLFLTYNPVRMIKIERWIIVSGKVRNQFGQDTLKGEHW